MTLFTEIRSTGREAELELGRKEKTKNVRVVWDVFEVRVRHQNEDIQ